jgi:hypothetical protein
MSLLLLGYLPRLHLQSLVSFTRFALSDAGLTDAGLTLLSACCQPAVFIL